MKLLITETSPYARAVRIAVRELALLDDVTEVTVALRTAANETLQHNPTGKIPTLLTDDGTVLCEGQLVARYLAQQVGDAHYASDDASVAQTALAGIVTGFVDGVSVWVREARRPHGEKSPDIIRQETERALRCLAWFEDRVDQLSQLSRYHQALLASGLDRLDTVAEGSWRQSAVTLGAWIDVLEAKPAFEQTRPG